MLKISAMLQLLNISKSFSNQGAPLLEGIGFSLPKKEIHGLLGPNGAGKTTLFSMILGLIPTHSGFITLDDLSLNGLSPSKRLKAGLSYLPQESSLFGDLSVFENIECVLEGRGLYLSRQERLAKAKQLLERVGLDADYQKLARYLSGGQKRRLEFARLLATEPKYVLLDEPFAGVDPKSIKEIQHQILLLKSHAIGILLSDHNVEATLTICDQAHILMDGRILASGKPEELRQNKLVQEYYLATSTPI